MEICTGGRRRERCAFQSYICVREPRARIDGNCRNIAIGNQAASTTGCPAASGDCTAERDWIRLASIVVELECKLQLFEISHTSAITRSLTSTTDGCENDCREYADDRNDNEK